MTKNIRTPCWMTKECGSLQRQILYQWLSRKIWAGSNSTRAHESRWECLRVSGQTRARVWTLNNSHSRLARALQFQPSMYRGRGPSTGQGPVYHPQCILSRGMWNEHLSSQVLTPVISVLVVTQMSTVVPSPDGKNSSKSDRSSGTGSSSVVTPVVVAVAVTMVAIILIIVLIYLRKKHLLISRTGKGWDEGFYVLWFKCVM